MFCSQEPVSHSFLKMPSYAPVTPYMAPTSNTINPKWGESLVGLRMAVPLSWWPGYSGTELSLGNIAKFDAVASLPFLLEVDNECFQQSSGSGKISKDIISMDDSFLWN